MAFRDDRDAQLHRADALERENARLRERLAEHEAKAAAGDDARRSAEELERENAELRERLERESAELREKLVRARGPSLARRIVSRIASLKLPEPRTDGGYAAAASTGWRLYVPVLVALAIPAAAAGGAAAWALAGFAVGAPALAVVFALVPWALGRRRRATAGLATGTAIGIATSLGFTAPLLAGFDHFLPALGSVFVGVVLLFLTGGMRVRDFPYLVLPFTPVVLFPHPLHVMLWVGFAWECARLADPDFK